MGCINNPNAPPNASQAEHAAKWFFCHPCYLAQLLRGSRMAVQFVKNPVSAMGAPEVEIMER